MWKRCRLHLAEAGETYLEHLRFAGTVGLMLIAAGLACIIHGLIPGCCTKTASRTVDELRRLFQERDALAVALNETSGALTLVGLIALTLPAWTLVMLARDHPLPAAIAALALAIPFAYLWTNPQLDPV
jgi:uncharacterized protein YjeT (DUF2065 family)